MADLTIKGKNTEQRALVTSVAEIPWTDFDGLNSLDLFELPARCFIKSITMIVEQAFNATVSLAVDRGVGDGTDNAVLATLVASTSTTSTTSPQSKGNSITTTLTGRNGWVETGLGLKLDPSGAVPTQGFVTVIVEWYEYTRGTGFHTNYKPNA